MKNPLTIDQKEQFNELLEILNQTLDISETEYNAAIKSYEAVGNWLSNPGSILAPYKPVIRPQGSFLLGTMIKNINGKDDIDIDLVCQLTGKKPSWTQYDIKQAVGDQLKNHSVYGKMLKTPDGRRCWTLPYSDSANYHMDILPAIVSENYAIIIEKSFSAIERTDFAALSIRITDKYEKNYRTDTNPDKFLKSNPIGYGKWFYQRALLDHSKTFSITEAVEPFPKFQKQKLPLQKLVQILKRHRDVMFNGDEDKPISVIITTLAAKAYNKETNIIEGLLNIVQRIPALIEERYDSKHNRKIKWIGNPVNDDENFGDKWPENPKKEKNFYAWLDRLQSDLTSMISQKGMQNVHEVLKKPFGEDIADKIFSEYGRKERASRESGKQFIASKTGIIGSVGTIIKNHNFHGKRE